MRPRSGKGWAVTAVAQAQAQHNRAIVEARNRSTLHYHQSTTPKFGIISNLSSSFSYYGNMNILSLSLMFESLVQKIAKFLLVDNLSCEREIEKKGREMRELSTVYTYRKYERERER